MAPHVRASISFPCLLSLPAGPSAQTPLPRADPPAVPFLPSPSCPQMTSLTDTDIKTMYLGPNMVGAGWVTPLQLLILELVNGIDYDD